jgi:hypothetical protein
MVDTVTVSPTAQFPTHHLSLTDGVSTIGIVLCDSKGNPSNLALRETPVPPQVTRVASTDSGYADFEQPYSVTVQEDWSGGRGQEDFEDDKTRFYDSNAINTSRGDIICGPLPTYDVTGTVANAYYFEYYSSTFCLLTPKDNSTAPTLWMHGLRGLAVANTGALNKLKTSRSLVGYNLAGCIARIIEGPGFEEDQNWRVIVSNTTTGTNDTITVSPSWNIEHTTATRYVIDGMPLSGSWTQITGHGLTKIVTDVLVVDTIVYICQGDGAYIRRGKIKTDESWETWAADGTNYAYKLEMIADKTGKRQIWKTGLTDVAVADVVGWGTNLTFGTAITCGNAKTRITNLIGYSDPQKPYVMKEDAWGSVYESVWAQIPLGEMAAVRDPANGQAAAQNDVYLYFSLRNGLERYYNGKLDDMGPNKDYGLPAGEFRSGPITNILSYPTGLICAVDAGTDGYSSIMHYNKTGWHEWYRAALGWRIRRMYIQTIPGSYSLGVPDRLWWYESDGLSGRNCVMPIAANPRQQMGYHYATGGQVISSYIYTSLAEIVKYWSAIKVFSENCLAGHRTITVEYRTDTATAWTTAGTITTSPSQEISLGSHNVTGRRLQYRLTLNTDDADETPRVKRVLVEAVQRVPPKRVWTINFYLADEWANLQGTELTATAKAITDQLTIWADSRQTAAPLILHHNFDLWDDIYVFVEPASIQPIAATEVEHGRSIRLVGQMTLREA